MSLNIIFYTFGFVLLAGATSGVLIKANRPASNALLLNLALVAGTGVLLAMGSLEIAGRHGYTLIMAMISFTLIFLVSPLIFFPLRRLVAVVKFATPIDFLTFRYRKEIVAKVTCLCFIVGSAPLFFAQFSALLSLLEALVPQSAVIPALWVIGALTALFNRHTLESDKVRNLLWLMSSASLLLLSSMAMTAWLCIDNVFGNLDAMNQWIANSSHIEQLRQTNPEYSIVSIFMIASIALPLNFNLVIKNEISDRLFGATAYGYPLLIMLLCIPVLPLLWAGKVLQPAVPLQDYPFSLPLLLDSPVIAALSAASILLLAISLISSLSIMLAQMILNSFYLPEKKLQNQPNIDKWITHRMVVISLALITLTLLLYPSVTGMSVTDYYLLAFSGLAQLTPGILAAIYLPRINRRGFLIGLCGGMFIWFSTLMLPMFVGELRGLEGYFSISFGMQNWAIWSVEALLINILLCSIFSAFTPLDEEQVSFARLCMADNVYVPARVSLKQKSVAEIQKSLEASLGDSARVDVSTALGALNLDMNERRPAALRQLRDQLSASLNLRLGVLAATRVMQQTLPLAPSTDKEPNDIYLIESMLAIHGNRLTGVASELNKLRVHHQEILDNLPIGLIAMAPSGEVLKWNVTMTRYTLIPAELATGGSMNELPQPWRDLFIQFLQKHVPWEDNLRISIDGHERWFYIRRSGDLVDDDTGDRILLIEEQTQAVRMRQSYMENERLASVGRLAAGVAHEIGNPITAIACVAQNLHYQQTPAHIDTATSQILSQTQRIDRIVKSLINLSRGDDAELSIQQPVNLLQTINEAIQLLQLNGEAEHVKFECQVNPEILIESDAQKLIQIFLNILNNAIDASPDDACITITASQSSLQTEVTVSDQGTGVNETVRGRLFEPFVTSKEPGQGTGLGLWVVFNLTRELGGHVSVSSPAIDSDSGSTAVLQLPSKAHQKTINEEAT